MTAERTTLENQVTNPKALALPDSYEDFLQSAWCEYENPALGESNMTRAYTLREDGARVVDGTVMVPNGTYELDVRRAYWLWLTEGIQLMMVNPHHLTDPRALKARSSHHLRVKVALSEREARANEQAGKGPTYELRQYYGLTVRREVARGRFEVDGEILERPSVRWALSRGAKPDEDGEIVLNRQEAQILDSGRPFVVCNVLINIADPFSHRWPLEGRGFNLLDRRDVVMYESEYRRLHAIGGATTEPVYDMLATMSEAGRFTYEIPWNIDPGRRHVVRRRGHDKFTATKAVAYALEAEGKAVRMDGLDIVDPRTFGRLTHL